MTPKRKYYPLYDYLRNRQVEEPFDMKFTEIEKLIEAKLPASARKTRVWWANSSTTQSQAWLDANWVVDAVDLGNEQITFRPSHITYRITPIRRRPGWTANKIKELREFAGWTQQELADRMGVRQQTISEWETGLHQPRYSTSKHLNLIAREVNFPYQLKDDA